MKKLLPAFLFLVFNFQFLQSNQLFKPLSLDKDELVLKVRIIGVKDGDTVEVLYYQLPFTVRLEHIDAPEKKQAFGTVSKKKLSDLCFGQVVTIISKKKKGNYDRNGRLIAEIYLLNGLNVNKEMVKSGLAWHFKKYSTDASYIDLENRARKNKIGLWQNNNAVAPWDFRKK